MKSLIIFAGAGASRGVSRDKYPMALDFLERLPDNIKDSHLYKQLLTYHELSNPGTSVDIENVLWELGQLDGALKEFTQEGLFASKLLSNNQLREPPSGISGQQIQQELIQLKYQVNLLQNNINERVYEFYSQLPEHEELERSWLPLLKKAASKDFDLIDIVTTNYDLVIEEALDSFKDINIRTGHTSGRYPSVDLKEWHTPSTGLLTKLHGSVDWKRGNGSTMAEPVVRRGHAEFDDDHDKRLILYPGFKGTPSSEPFIAFHEHFRLRLKKTTHILFVGFAFRDDYINDLIKLNLPSNSKVAVVNPARELPSQAFLAKAKHLKQNFGILKKGIFPNAPFLIDDLDEWFK